MDSLTHALLGLNISRLDLQKRMGRGATALALVASELPDIDVLLWVDNPWATVEYHRTVTHSLLFVPAAAAVLAAIACRVSRCKKFRPVFGWTCVIILSHILLDLLTSYGTAILWPLSRHRFALDWVAVIDPAVTLVLAAGLVLPRFGRLASDARRVCFAALLACTAYLCLGGLQHARAMQALHRQLGRGERPDAAAAIPQIGSVFLWRTLARSGTALHLGVYNAISGRIVFSTVLYDDPTASKKALLNDRRVRQFNEFARGLIWIHADGQRCIMLEDMRFAWPTGAKWGIWALRVCNPAETPGKPPAGPPKVWFVQRRPSLLAPVPSAEYRSAIPAG